MTSNIFLLLNSILGLTLLSFSMNIIRQIRNECCNKLFIFLVYSLLIMSLLILLLSISTIVCRYRCDCSNVDPLSPKLIGFFFVLIGIAITVKSIVLQSISKIKRNCGISDGSLPFLIVIGTIITALSGFFLFLVYRFKNVNL